ATARPGRLALHGALPISGRAGPDDGYGLGRSLARLHRVRAAGFGWPSENFIGSLPQANGAWDDWPAFWRERRLEPQLRRAVDGRSEEHTSELQSRENVVC